MSKKLCTILSACACLIWIEISAQDTTLITSLEQVVITANKYPKKMSQTGKVLTLIARPELERSSGKTLGEVLNTVAGTTVIGSNSSPGINQTVSIRGASAGNVLILIDGIPVNDPSVNTNYFDLSFLSVEDIERIEILKGGQSTLYGSDAVAGVINVISKKHAATPLHFNSTLAAGSYSTYKANAGIDGATGKVNYSMYYGHLRSNGFSSAHDSTEQNNFEKDGYIQNSTRGNLQFMISPRFRTTAFGQYSRYVTDLDAASFTDDKDFTATNKNLLAGIGGIYTYQNTSVKLNYQYNYVRRSYLDDSTDRNNPFAYYAKSRYTGVTHFTELYGNNKWKNWEFLTGVDWRANNTGQEYFSFGQFGPFEKTLSDSMAKMSQVSLYSSAVYMNRGFVFEAGGRWNNHSEYGNNFTYTINPAYLIKNKIKLFANFYSAFKAPTLYQLFDPFIGNDRLEAESSKIIEGGLAIFHHSFDIRTVAFYRKTKNAIEFIITDPNFFSGQYRNVSNNQNHGLETEAVFQFSNWKFSGNYTFTKGKITSRYDPTGMELNKDTTYNNLYRVPEHAFNFIATFQATKALHISTHVRTAGKRVEPVYGARPIMLKGFYTIDVYSEYKFNSKLKFFLDLKNITNQEYFEILGYNTRGFNLMAGLSVNVARQ